jgi:hypothetical protein
LLTTWRQKKKPGHHLGGVLKYELGGLGDPHRALNPLRPEMQVTNTAPLGNCGDFMLWWTRTFFPSHCKKTPFLSFSMRRIALPHCEISLLPVELRA